MSSARPPGVSRAYWERFYRERATPRPARPNQLLLDEVTGLPPGAALDLACGRGGDAIWLAGRGWTVTAVDVSATALAGGAAQAAQAGLGDAITWEEHDLNASFPGGAFDLVAACYVHSPVALDRAAVLRAAAGAVAPGGTLVVVGHAGLPSWHTPDDGHVHVFPTPREVLADLALTPGGWDVLRAQGVRREMPDPEGNAGWRPDNVLTVRRRDDDANVG